MMELDEENEADSRLEDDDQVIEVINMVKDDLLIVVEMEDAAGIIDEVGGLDMVHTPLLGPRAERFGEDEMHTPDTEDTAHTTVLGPDVKYVQLADSHTHTHTGARDCADECISYRTGVQPTLPIPDMQKVSTSQGSPDFA